MRLTDPQTITFTNDEVTQGEIYYAVRKKIFKSTNFGTTFNLYRELDRDITGLYKKSGSNILYASTPLKIYEITPGTMNIIKELPVPDAVLNYYPLSVGNKWIYKLFRQEFNPPGNKEFIGFADMEVVGDTMLSNQETYFKLTNEPYYWFIDTAFIRPDSLEGKLYIFVPSENKEFVYDDFIADVGDTIWIDSIDYKTVSSEEAFDIWGLNTLKRAVDYSIRFQGYELVKNIGLFQWGFSDSYALYTRELEGCIINGVVYGDTTVVSVENETPNLPTKFSLLQNYPNPFNPTTKIRYEIPGQARKDNMLVTLKVYDVLGNEVTTLVNEEKPAGSYEVEFNGSNLTSGVYFYQLRVTSSKGQVFVQTKKMLLIK